MKVFLLVASIASLMTGAAFAQDAEKVNPLSLIDTSIVTDTSYNNDTEQTVTEFGAIVGFQNIKMSLLPAYNWETKKITDIEIAASYTINVMNNISVTPYGELHYDDDLERGAEIVGVKTKFNF
jgi:hypothetical protein